MSGGSHNYVYIKINEHLVGQMYDEELNDLMADIAELAHDLEWMDSSDINEEDYWEAVKKFKQKWFHGDRSSRLKGYCDKKIDQLREEIYRLLDGH